MTFAEHTFWGLLGVAAYIYVLYPLIVRLLAGFSPVTEAGSAERDSTPDDVGFPEVEANETTTDERPLISLVLYAHNEEATILKRLQTVILSSYPGDRFEVLVGCDGSDDLTAELVRSFEDSRVRLVECHEQRGRAEILNRCVEDANGELILFADSETCFVENSLEQVARHFDNTRLGCVYGRLVTTDPVTGETIDQLADRLSVILKCWESAAGMLPGMNGSVYAFRKELYALLPGDAVHAGFLVGMQVQRAGYRLIYDAEFVVQRESVPTFESAVWKGVKVTTDRMRDLWWFFRSLQFPRGRSAIAFWSHTVLRRLGPLALLFALVMNAALAGDRFYLKVLSLHFMGYMAGAFAFWVMNPEQQDLRFQLSETAFKFRTVLYSLLDRCKKQTEDTIPSEGEAEISSDEHTPIQSKTEIS